MDERPKDPELNALEGISHSPPRRKNQSYSQQLRMTTGGNQKRSQNHPRNHSLDEIEIFNSQPRKPGQCDGGVNSSDEEDFYRYSIGGAAEIMELVGTGDDDQFDESELLPNQPLPEFIGSGGGVGVFKAPIRAAAHPNRPPCLEIRPHPLRETQVGFY